MGVALQLGLGLEVGEELNPGVDEVVNLGVVFGEGVYLGVGEGLNPGVDEGVNLGVGVGKGVNLGVGWGVGVEPCFFLQLGHNHLVLLLFGKRLYFRQAR